MNRVRALRYSSQFFLAEFLVVILGVTSAFLGEAWWQNMSESELEKEYLQRLVEDLDYGFETLTRNVERITAAGEAAERIVEKLHKPAPDDLNAQKIDQYPPNSSIGQQLIDDFVLTSKTGGRGWTWSHETTFAELISTGRLNLISSIDLRAAISSYYRRVDWILTIRSEMPSKIADRMSTIILDSPRFLPPEGNIQITDELVSSIYFELSDPSIESELRETAYVSKNIHMNTVETLSENRGLRDAIVLELDQIK